MNTDTICAPCTSVGTGAVSIVRISGPDALAFTDKVVEFRRGDACGSKGYTIHFGTVTDGDSVLDEVLVSVYRSPCSYTGEDCAEICCHSSRFIVGRLVELLCEAGARPAGPGEFTRRAFLAGKMDLAQAEAVADLIAAESKAAHDVAFKQLKGAYSLKLKELRASMVEMKALLELELDFSEEDVEFAERGKLHALLSDTLREVERLCDSFRDGNALRHGIPVAIVGQVNAGKSTLLNALAGEQRAIVSDVPGTTRDTVESVMTLGGLQYRFIDTAGLRETSDAVEKIGISRTLDAARKADVVIEVLDGTAPLKDVQKASREMDAIMEGLDSTSLIVVRNKVDAYDAIRPEDFPGKDRTYGMFDLRYPAFGTYDLSPAGLGEILGHPDLIDISASTGEGLDELRSRIGASQRGRFPGEVVITNSRHLEALRRAEGDLRSSLSGLDSGLPSDLIAEDLGSAITDLGAIFGDVTSDEVLGEIFGRFCIGK